MKKTMLIPLILVAFITISSSDAFACSCLKPGSPREGLQRSDAVFLGTVLDVNRDTLGGGYKVKFEVERSWKGASEQVVTVKTGLGGGDCGYIDQVTGGNFVKGKKYVVYAVYGDDDTLSTGLCSRTVRLEFAEQDLQELGEGTTIFLRNIDNVKPDNLLWVVPVIGFILLMGILFYFLRRHRKPKSLKHGKK